MTQIADPIREESVRERLLARVAMTLEGYLAYHDELASTSAAGWPTFSQSIRIKALLDNKRILVADDTGVNGKTFTTAASKFALDKTGSKHPALIVAPNSGMLNAWAPSEINRYAGYVGASEQNVVTVSEFKDFEKVDRDTDFAVVNWEKLSLGEKDPRWHQFKKAIERQGTRFYGFDECHNGKGSNSLRGQTNRRLVDYTRGQNLMLLSATPIPNRYRDLGMIFHMLDPDKYQSPSMFSHAGPEVIKELLDRQVWFRLTRQDLKEELGLPDFLEPAPIEVNLRDDESEAYFKAWADCVSLGEGLTELRRTLYDPRLSKYGAAMGISRGSSKLEKVAQTVGRLREEGQKVLVHTKFVTGVIDQIKEAAGKSGEALVVTGDTPLEQRNRLYWQFKNTGPEVALVVSSVAEESVDLTTGDIPCSILNVEPQMTPREDTQLTGRVYRRGQRGVVTNLNFIAQSPTLNQLMLGHLDSLREQYGVSIPKKYVPRTIDRDMLAMRLAKQEIVGKVYGGERITKQQEALYDANEVDNAVTHLQGLVTPSTFKSIRPFELSAIIQSRWRNLGEEQFTRLVKSKGWRKWRTLYEDGWEGSASQATLQLVGKVIDGLEGKISEDPTIVDVGSGAAYFSRATGKPVTCVDLDPKFLEKGRRICEKLGINNKYVAAPATSTGLRRGKADAVVNAYTIFYLGQDKGRNEIEQCVLETNRITRKGGHFIIALPYSIDESAVKRFSDNIAAYGFEEQQRLGRKETKSPRMKNGCHIIDYEKVSQCLEPQGRNLSFYSDIRRFVG